MKTILLSVFMTIAGLFANIAVTASPSYQLNLQQTNWPVVSQIKFLQQHSYLTIQWTADAETEDMYYEVEKSYDGVTYKTAALIMGGEQVDKNYSYSFKLKNTANEKVIYRIWQVKKDGSSRLVGEQSYQK